MGLRESYAAAYVHCLVVGEGVLTLPLAVRREILVRMGGLYNPSFRKPRPKGGRGRPPLQLEWDGCEICRRAYRHTRYVGEVGRIIPTFPVVPRKGRRGRRPLRLGGKPTVQQPSIAVANGSAMAHRGRCALQGWVSDARFSSHPSPYNMATQGASRTPTPTVGW